MRRIIVLLAAVIAAVSLGACAEPGAYVAPARPQAQGWPQANSYLKAHPHKAGSGWLHGVVVSSKDEGYVCLNGYCHTWKAQLVLDDGTGLDVASYEGDDDLYKVVYPGDDILIADMANPTKASDVQVLFHNVVAVGPAGRQ